MKLDSSMCCVVWVVMCVVNGEVVVEVEWGCSSMLLVVM